MATIIHSGKMLKSKEENRARLKVHFTRGETALAKATGDLDFPAAIPHKDLIKVLQALRIHFAILGKEFIVSEEVTETKKGGKTVPKFKNKDMEENFRVTGVKVASNNGIITLSGQRLTDYIQWKTFVANINPNVSEDDPGVYPYIDDLQEKVNLVLVEFALLYEENKMGDDPQLSMDLPEDIQE